jgi:hypothetical protein
MLAKIDFGPGIQDAWSKITTTVPKLLSFVLVLVIGMIVAKFLTSAVKKILKTVKFDQKMEKIGIERHVARTGMSSSNLVAKIVKLTLAWIVWTTAFATFGPSNPVSKFLNSVINYIPKVVVAIVILAVTAALAGLVGDIMSRGVAAAKFPAITARIAPIAIWVLGGFAAVDQLGVASSTTHTLFQALMAVIVGSAIVAVGGGGIAPMRKQWENVIAKQQAKPAAAAAEVAATDGWPVTQQG